MPLRIVLALALLFALAIGTISSPESLAEGTPKPTPSHPGSGVPAPRPAQPTPGSHPTSPPSTVSPTPAPTQATTTTPTPRPTNAPAASNFPRWSDAANWPGGRLPTRDNDVVIPAGRVIEVDTLSAEARTVTIDGTLRASRVAASRLSVFGNVVVRNQGVLDYGQPTDRVQVPASIRFFLDEARVVGGPVMDPVESDVGLWGIDDSRVFVHGMYRDTWSPLVETSRAGSIEIHVDPAWSRGWRVGDLVLVGPSNLRTVDGDYQDEVRRITADVGNGRFQLDAALRFNHEVLTVPWTDAWGVAYTERLAAKVANLTSNVVFEAGDPNHRPHVMFLERAKHYVEDLAVVNFSPMPKQNPMARYAWHEHLQGNGSRGSYLRRTRLYGGPGDGLHIHESAGVEVEDIVVYNQARAYVQRSNGTSFTNTIPIMLEQTTPVGNLSLQGHAADDCWIDRALVVRWGTEIRDYRNSGFWLDRSVNCAVLGSVTAGSGGQVFSSGFHWPETNPDGTSPWVYRAESNSNRTMGFLAWQNNMPNQAYVDLLAWRNGETGIFWGAYQTSYWAFQVRVLGNGLAQLAHVAAGWGITGFLADGMGVPGTVGIRVGAYFNASSGDTVYEDGIVRNVATNLIHASDSAGGERSWIQFARVRWDPQRGIAFGLTANPPQGSRFRVRQQTGLSRAGDFTLYRRDDTGAPGSKVLDAEYNALRWDNDTQGTRPRPPRVVWSGPSDETTATGSITLTVQSDGSEVEFYLANNSLGRVRVAGGFASLTFNMASHPRRRAYFWATALGSNGAVNTSRVLRVNKF